MKEGSRAEAPPPPAGAGGARPAGEGGQESPAHRALHHPWASAVLRSLGLDGVEQSVDPRDEMFEQALLEQAGDVDAAVASYFGSGAEIALTLRRFCRLQWAEGPASVLDFGAGYGRVTRFLQQVLRPAELWASDVVASTLPFQERLGVRTFLSDGDPSAVPWPARRFDLIYVGSLFTHLPEAAFGRWLDALFGRLEEEGVLLFSVHDDALRPERVPMPNGGLAFEARSEARDLDHSVYGSAWVTQAFVRERIDELSAAVGAPLHHRRYPRSLCGYQDLVAVSRRPLDEGGLGGLGRIDDAVLTGSKHDDARSLSLAGWFVACGSLGDGTGTVRRTGVEVEARLIGRDGPIGSLSGDPLRAWVSTAGARPDLTGLASTVAACIGESAWALQLPLPSAWSRGCDLLLVTASARDAGVPHVLHAGSVDRLLWTTTDEAHRRRRDRVFELAETIDQMRASRFWSARRSWFRLKRALGLTREPPDGPELRPSDRRP